MKNFEKADIITYVAINKNKSKFLPRNEQMIINRKLRDKLIRFLKEIQDNKNRPKMMKSFDGMMNEMHGQRVKDLYEYRKNGNHIVGLIDSQVPPELIYGINKFVPVGVCMGAGEVEKYVDIYTKELATPIRSMIGFLATGMCVFLNLSDYIIGTDLSYSLKKSTDLIKEIAKDIDVFCISYRKIDNKTEIDFTKLIRWIETISSGKGINRTRFIKYCKLYTSIRDKYKQIDRLRRDLNPPIDGCNNLWIEQLYPVEDPSKLLKELKKLHKELEQNIKKGIGYNENGEKKRVLLITPRIMPPFTEIYRLIERNGGLIVHEQTDMGITNIEYSLDKLISMTKNRNWPIEKAIRYVVESVNTNNSSSFTYVDKAELQRVIRDYTINAVICFNFQNIPEMDEKIKGIIEFIKTTKIPSMTIKSDYIEMYESENSLSKKIQDFLR